MAVLWDAHPGACRCRSKQIIAQAELLPVVTAKRTWGSLLAGAHIIWFVDNEAARAALIRSTSQAPASRELVLLSVASDLRLGASSWYSRVPTAANVADGPSRLQLGALIARGAIAVAPNIPSLAQMRDLDVKAELTDVCPGLPSSRAVSETRIKPVGIYQ